ncbi:phosphomevalonate kinase [Allomyces macrogynus ATCC 38327]|uniref:Phosphomevalonate kinase n=1 Tax=Allomyces macrogynus (strain ATCC 38327) TaxID=578462 RepID=A0A0L0STS0_ALLM3|nr:phosphomevalonate kinase [Allomyces macrogynus ATCC 38327]|eukprot:KNE65714.1 phosphomevalonate kinase [Allomyces macrogynus ATCC 38327]
MSSATSVRKAPVAVSAPGKALIAGGYLVLDRAYSGVVVATTSRFYTVIQPRPATNDDGQVHVTITSPQFTDPARSYVFDAALENAMQKPATTNPFIDGPLLTALRVARARVGAAQFASLTHGSTLAITILADNDFYSQRAELDARKLPATSAALLQLPPFVSQNKSVRDVQKTGLGSSAALVTSLVGAVLRYFTDTVEPKWSHHVAQWAHCLAQGKIGSGFDVSSAAFGTHRYRRFEPSGVAPLLERGLNATGDELVRALDPASPTCLINTDVAPFRLPRGVAMLLADVAAGSNTPSLVSKVLAWRKADRAAADQLWNRIHKANMDLVAQLDTLDKLAARNAAEYDRALQTVVTQGWGKAADGKEVVQALVTVKDTLKTIRQGMRTMGECCQVPIEPDVQTSLIDECASLPGVLGAGVSWRRRFRRHLRPVLATHRRRRPGSRRP